MDKYIQSAIVGYWRSGATVFDIMNVIDGLMYSEVKHVIETYKKKLKE